MAQIQPSYFYYFTALLQYTDKRFKQIIRILQLKYFNNKVLLESKSEF